MGIHSPLDDQPSLALGSSDVNLLEMVNAYCVIADNGKHHDPVLVTRIVDHEGNEVYVGPKTDEQVIPYKSAFFMQKLLMSGTHDAGGTSVSFSSADYAGSFFRDTDFGGKTGTSNNHSDAWFIAVSPKLVVGAWVGGEYRSIHFRTGALGQGSKTALPICGYFIKSVFSDPAFQGYHGKFDKPKDEDITSDMYGCESYYKPVVRDTVKEDSLTHEDEIQLDANGNPIPRNLMESVQGIKVEEQKGEKKRTHPTEQTVTLEDL